ncbi:MAG: EamA family transporter [Hyphomicrobiales bacterium]|nr:EamA family transporter [Hyphomicrobiales bacterium]
MLTAAGNRRGIIAMVLAVIAFTATDVLMKFATGFLPTSQILAMRGAMAMAMTIAFLGATGSLRHAALVAQPRVVLRTAFETGMILCYVTALSMAPIANVFSVLQSAPILITAFAALVWREKVGWRRWTAIFAGFAGVALIVRPSPQGLDPAMGLAVIAVVLVSARDLTTRTIPPFVPSPIVTLCATIGSTSAGVALAPFETWVTPSPLIWGVLAGAAFAVACGNYAVIIAFRVAQVSAIAPFRYLGVPIAILLGWLVWGHVPDALAFVGIGAVVAAGLYTMQRGAPRKA